MEVTMKRVILSALMLVALSSGTCLLDGVAVAAEERERPAQTLFGEGYAQLYQKDRAMVHEMMEMMQETMGMMKGMAQDTGMKGKVGKRMERMDKLMKEHSEAPLKAIFGTGYPFQPQ